MAKEWTDDEVQAAIREAVRIVHEDRERATYKSLHERYGQDGKTDDKTPPPPNNDDNQPPEPPKKKRTIWWPASDNE